MKEFVLIVITIILLGILWDLDRIADVMEASYENSLIYERVLVPEPKVEDL